MEENNDNKDKEVTPLKNITDSKLLNQVTHRDLIFFKEDILKELRQYTSKINSSLSEKFNKFVEDAYERLPDALTENGGLYMKNIKFIEEKNNILSTVSEKENFLNEKIMVNELHINNCQKELNDAVFKYDRAILDNLLIPGIVGKGCKFLNFKDYMIDVQGQINNAFSKLDFNLTNINKNRKNFEEKINQANSKIKNLDIELKQLISEKISVLERQMKQEMETMNKRIIELTGEFYKNNVELKNQIGSLKSTEKLITEENRKINVSTLNEFEKMQKGFKLMKKSIIDLGKLLMLSDKRTNKNKNFAANKYLLIEQFNNMMLNLMKDVKKENGMIQSKESLNQKKDHPKKAVSVIKRYIEGKINAENTVFIDLEKKERNKNNISRENEEIFSKNYSKRKSFAIKSINEDSNSSRLNNININNNKVGVSFDRNKKFTRHASVDFRDTIFKKNSFGNNSNNNDIDPKKNNNLIINYNNILGEINKSRHFEIIKEENNNASKSEGDSLFTDLEEDFKNLNLNEHTNFNNYKGNENRKYEEEISLFNNENSFNKSKKINKNKLFFRGITTNYDNIFPKRTENIQNTHPTQEKFKLLLKAQENLKKKNLEKLQSLKKDSDSIQDKELESKTSEKKISFSQNNMNTFIQESSRFENKTSNKMEETINSKNNDKKSDNKNFNIETNEKKSEKEELKNEANIKINDENKISKEIKKTEEKDIMNKNEIKSEENIKRPLEKLNDFPKEKALLNYKLKDNLEKETLTQKNNQHAHKINFFNTDNNFSKTTYRYTNKSPRNSNKNLSPQNNNLKLAKIENNKDNFKRQINLSANIKMNDKHIVNNLNTQSNETKVTIPNLRTINNPLDKTKDSIIKSNNNFKIKKSFNPFNEDIFINKDDIKKMNYYRDKDIIDKPLLVNQINFRVQNSKGSVENKIIELEYFTKKKFDELVREIKNFIPIHFNAYVKE